jgi:hypothetical protein
MQASGLSRGLGLKRRGSEFFRVDMFHGQRTRGDY